MGRAMAPVRRAGRWMLGRRPVRAAAVAAAAARGRGLVLIYHRVVPAGPAPPWEIAPSVTRAQLDGHLQTLAAIGEVVPLADLLTARRGGRARFAVTFDDDYPSHVAQALPVLTAAGVTATFFLSGRALRGLSPYWWQRLEALLATEGVREAAAALGVPAAEPVTLAAACERDTGMRARLEEVAPSAGEPLLDEAGIKRLAAADMTIGFHTRDHPLLTMLGDDVLADTLTAGRAELAAAVEQPLDLFAYPHGRADRRVVAATRAAGYRAAWTGWPRPIRPGEDPFLLGRWEPGRLEADRFAGEVTLRLHRAAPAAGG